MAARYALRPCSKRELHLVLARSSAAVALLMSTATSSISLAYAQDVAEGERLYRQRCASCHALEEGQNRAGPTLAKIIGRRPASVTGARYSAGMQKLSAPWDEVSLDRFMANPRDMVPGTSMTVGVPDAAQRQAIIAFLKTTSR